jgi:hypothetical protein
MCRHPCGALQNGPRERQAQRVAINKCVVRDLKTDPLIDSLRNEPRFQAIERELKFPN